MLGAFDVVLDVRLGEARLDDRALRSSNMLPRGVPRTTSDRTWENASVPSPDLRPLWLTWNSVAEPRPTACSRWRRFSDPPGRHVICTITTHRSDAVCRTADPFLQNPPAYLAKYGGSHQRHQVSVEHQRLRDGGQRPVTPKVSTARNPPADGRGRSLAAAARGPAYMLRCAPCPTTNSCPSASKAPAGSRLATIRPYAVPDGPAVLVVVTRTVLLTATGPSRNACWNGAVSTGAAE